MFNLLSSWAPSFLAEAKDYVGGMNTGVGLLAAAILSYALLVPYLETKKTKATFALGADFFQKFVYGNILFVINAVFGIVDNAMGGYPQTQLYFLFAVFIFVNSLGFYLNSGILKLKKANMAAAEEKGISEFEYWDKYLKNT